MKMETTDWIGISLGTIVCLFALFVALMEGS